MVASRLVAAFCAVAMAASAPATARGQSPSENWTIAISTKIDSGSGRVQSTGLRYLLAGGTMRMEIKASSSAMLDVSGMYMVSREGDSSITTVIPQQQTAMVMSA